MKNRKYILYGFLAGLIIIGGLVVLQNVSWKGGQVATSVTSAAKAPNGLSADDEAKFKEIQQITNADERTRKTVEFYDEHGDSASAIKIGDEGIKRSAGDWWLVARTGKCYAKLGNFDKAHEYIAKALQIDPKAGYVYHTESEIYRIQKDLAKAKASLQKHLEVAKDDGDRAYACSGLVEVALEENDLGAAKEYVAKGLKFQPDHAYLKELQSKIEAKEKAPAAKP